MPTIKYSDNPNEETAFVTQDGGQRNRAVLTAAVDGTIEYSNNPNSTKVMVTVDGVKRRAVAVADIAGGGGGDQHNLGWYATESALTTAHPTANDGDWAIVGSTDTVWVWDSDTNTWKDTDQKGQVTSVNGQTGDVVLDLLPDQTGQSGKFLTTDGTDASWSDKPLVNTATGTDSFTIAGNPTSQRWAFNIGETSSASQESSFAVGQGASASGVSSMVIGNYSRASGMSSIAIKANASANYAIGIGGYASAVGAIQIGSYIQSGSAKPQNFDANTVKIANANGNFEIMSADGTIPTARLTKVNTTITLAAADWSSNTQTVSVTGMTADGVVMVSPAPTDQSAYTSAGVLCTAQAAGTLTFTCDTVPSGDLSVNVICL